jgi:predicted TIM-barrel fold metal-dependent hydrolase
VYRWWRSIDGIIVRVQEAPANYMKARAVGNEESTDPENILRYGQIQRGYPLLLPESMMDTTGYTSRWSTNGDTWKAVQTHPNRFIIEPNLSPIKQRGVKNAIWEMEYWAEQGAKIFKYYSPEDTFINDPDLWPFYKRAASCNVLIFILLVSA